ncbi:MAG TPA: hypothetical protein VIX89_10810 [Bryobacteraceae bacterium]
MHPEKDLGALDGTAKSDLWRNTLSRISSVFGRLVYLAKLRNSNSGQYEHYGLTIVFGDLEAHRALKKSHRETFSEWISFSIERQKSDLELYFSDQPEDQRTILKTWEKLQPYRNFPPTAAKDVEKKLYLADLRAILAVLKNASDRNASDAGDPDPDPDSD